ncbi:RnaseH-domain-containing protein [Neolentinus lepideus HHB14362 ss-1]|uniref:ribonuclease H n=1 Tax=Neolentinus lepideus HHB14362 ss-1 TaxID=1314782 RepID=A0A165TSX5_9AGAM|nr:RnaseH-domain-containing protein [Neolentinus lepideus HHB14362 ss-1]
MLRILCACASYRQFEAFIKKIYYLRIFTSGDPHNDAAHEKDGYDPDHLVTIATDGSCLHTGTAKAVAGAGGFASPEHPANFSLRLPMTLTQSNQCAELLALHQAASFDPPDTQLFIETDSRYAMNAVSKHLHRHEDEGFIGASNGTLIRDTVARLRARELPTYLKWVKGHAGHERNERADQAAGAGAALQAPSTVDTQPASWLRVSGARVTAITQALAYRAIHQRKLEKYTSRARTATNIELAQDAAEEAFGYRPSEGQIWRSQRSKDVSREARCFLWMATHDAYMIGEKWLRPSVSVEKQARALCPSCGVLETLAHILMACDSPGQREIWDLV